MQEALARGTMMLLALPHFEVSVVLPENPAPEAAEAAVQVAQTHMKQLQPLLPNQLKSIGRGLPVQRRLVIEVKDEPEEEAERKTKQEIAEGKQAVLNPVTLPGLIGSKTLGLKKADPPSSSSRAATASDASKAKDKEKKQQADAAKKARVRQEKAVEEAKAKAKPRATSKKQPPAKKQKREDPPEKDESDSDDSSVLTPSEPE